MIPEYILRQVCISSKKFSALVLNLDIVKMGSTPRIDFSHLSEEERNEIIEWTFNDKINTPAIIQEYINKCKKE
jgi:hypothetical protein